MNKPKFHIAKGDTVEVTTGAHKGAKGTVLRIIAGKQQALIEGVRMITKAVKPVQGSNNPSGLVKQEGPVHISNLKVVAARAAGKKPTKDKAAAKAPAKKAPAKKAAAKKKD
jgi:large subunit ribosomal protein L24